NRHIITDIRTGCEPEPADEACGKVRNDIPVQVRQHEDIVQFRLLDELHTHIVYYSVLECDVGVPPGHVPGDLKEETVGIFHNIRLVHRGHLLPPVLLRIFKGERHDP